MQPRKPWPVGLKVAALFVAVVMLALLCIAAPRAVGRLAPIWLPNAVIFSVYLRSPSRQWWLIALAGVAGNLTANFLAGDHAALAFSLSGANFLECLGCALAIRRLRGGDFDIARTDDLLRLAVVVLPCATLLGVISATAVGVFRGDEFTHSLHTWMASHTLGYFILAPSLLLLSRPRNGDEPRLHDHGWTLLVLAGVVIATFAQSSYPLLFLIPPALLLVTWRLELFGSAVGVLLTAAIGTVLSLAGHGPTSLAHGDANAKIVVFQAFLVVTLLASLPVANQRALSRRLQASLSKALSVAKEDAFKLEMATSVARLGHWSLDARTGALTWSRQMYEIFGLSPDGDVDLAEAMRRVHPDDAPECQRLVDRALQFGEDYVQERIRIFRPDGEMRVTGGAVICQRDAAGAVITLFGALSDKTEQEDARLQRGLLEQRYVEIAGKASDIVLRLDPDGVCLSVNPACESVLGYRVEALVGRTLGWLVHEEDYGLLNAALLAVRQGEVSGERLLYRARHKDGRWKWLESQPQAVRDPFDSRVLETSDVIRDVTDLRTAEQAARESEQRYRLMAENSTDIIITCALDGLIAFASPALKMVAGYDPEALIGKTALDVCHPEDRQPIQANFMRVIAGGAPERLRWRGRHQTENRWIWFESSPALLRDPETGAPTGYLDVIRDVTAQKAQEDALAQARLNAETAMRSKADFLANMSHELRTPLNSIIGFSRLLAERDTLSIEDRRQVDLVHGAGQALHAVIDNVLDFSKLEVSALTLDAAPFDLVALARRTLALLEPQGAEKGIDLTFDLAGPASLWVRGDEGRLRQVLLNYLSNAVKFTREGGVKVRLEAERDDEGQARFRLAVADTGVGIAPDKLAGLFTRFTQAEADTAARYGGTGLGLAISKQLIELMGGTVGASSVIGEGSTFWLSLALPIAEAVKMGAIDTDAAPSFVGRTILVVDDVDLNRQLMSALLSRQGCVIDLAENGAEAIERLETRSYDLVLMDCQMPVMDGFAATRTIRASGAPYASTPIVALTASADVVHLARCEAAGMDAHLTKPLNPGALEAVMRRFLAEPGPAPGVAACDPSLRQGLVDSLGSPAVISLLTLLLDQLAEKLKTEAADTVLADAHALAGACGLMGYTALSEACRDLETVVDAGGDFAGPLARVRGLMVDAGVDARDWLEALSVEAA